MKLSNFEESFNDVILRRGRDYYLEGNVGEIEFDGRTYTAEVIGTYDYTVKITVSNSSSGEIVETTCDCPYDLGDYCKHQAAVLYALNDSPEIVENVKSARGKNISEILNELDRGTLVSLLLDYAENICPIKDDLLLRFGEKRDASKYARKVIKNSIKNKMRKGFIQYDETYDALEGAHTVLSTVENYIEDGDILSAVSVLLVVLTEAMDILECSDDSDGYVCDVISQAIDMLGMATFGSHISNPEGEKIFSMIFDHAKSERYDGWEEWRSEILTACIPFCADKNVRKKLENYLTKLDILHKNPDSYQAYNRKLNDKIRYQLIGHLDGEKAAKAFVLKHLATASFREIAIKDAIDAKEYEEAEKLCAEGESIDEKSRGILLKWKRYRYEVYEKMGDVQGQKDLAFELVLSGEYEYYEKLKRQCLAKEWSHILQKLLSNLENDAVCSGVYLEIIKEERLTERILRCCTKNNYLIVKLYPYLKDHFDEEVDAIFRKYVLDEAKEASSRRQYAEICRIIRKYKEACGAEKAKGVAEQLLLTYLRRPAFIDELNKLKF